MKVSNLHKDFHDYMHESRHKQCDKELSFSYLEMAVFWEYVLHTVVETGVYSTGKKLTENEMKMAKEGILRIGYEKKFAMEDDQYKGGI